MTDLAEILADSDTLCRCGEPRRKHCADETETCIASGCKGFEAKLPESPEMAALRKRFFDRGRELADAMRGLSNLFQNEVNPLDFPDWTVRVTSFKKDFETWYYYAVHKFGGLH